MNAAVSRTLLVSFGFAALALAHARGAEFDWPQWRGLERTGHSKETGLLTSWPKDGPKLLWRIKTAGAGYSGPAVADGSLYTMGNRGEDEYVLCYDVKDSREKWAVKTGRAYRNGYGDGPRSTPTVDGERVYALGANGDLCCLKTADGAVVWRVNILEKFKGANIGWGISESPLVEGNMVIVTPGGDLATMAALDKLTGKVVWTSKDPARARREEAGYASPIAFTVGGTRQVATFTAEGAYGARASDGKFLWRYDRVANDTANIATPIYHDGHIFFSSDYGTGCVLLKLTAAGSAEEVYFTRDLRNHHGGVVLVGGHLYGYSGSVLVCMEWATGKVAWQNRSVGKGSLAYADGHLYVRSEDGVMALVAANPKAYTEKSRFHQPDRSDQPSWPHPVIANGRLYLRDQDTILCYDVKQR
jgi:outer membrane protein assembly factor BamB